MSTERFITDVGNELLSIEVSNGKYEVFLEGKFLFGGNNYELGKLSALFAAAEKGAPMGSNYFLDSEGLSELNEPEQASIIPRVKEKRADTSGD